jgi:hypothetical protein
MRWFTLLIILTLCGCTQYEFDITTPPEVAAHVPRKSAVTVQRAPLLYRMQAAEGRLVMKVHNETDQPLELLGDKSYVVDPHGQSHPLQSQTIAPNSFIKLILPPFRPVYRAAPGFGFGLGVGISRMDRGHFYQGGFYDPYYADWDEPLYMTVYDDGTGRFWEWTGETSIQLRLVYQQGDRTFDHEFAIRRVKAR